MSTSFIEETSHTRIDLYNRLLVNQNELQVQIQQLIKNYRNYYSGKLNQLNNLWQQFCDLDKELKQAALPTESEYSSQLVALKIFLDNKPTGSGLPKAPRRASVNFRIAIDTVSRCREDTTNLNNR